MNDDCVVEPSALAEMLAAGAGGDDIGSVAAQILFADQKNTINSAGIEVDELGIAHERLLGEEPGARGTDDVEVSGACAAAALYRRAMLDEIGGFDESFSRTWRMLILPGVRGWPDGGASMYAAPSSGITIPRASDTAPATSTTSSAGTAYACSQRTPREASCS